MICCCQSRVRFFAFICRTRAPPSVIRASDLGCKAMADAHHAATHPPATGLVAASSIRALSLQLCASPAASPVIHRSNTQ